MHTNTHTHTHTEPATYVHMSDLGPDMKLLQDISLSTTLWQSPPPNKGKRTALGCTPHVKQNGEHNREPEQMTYSRLTRKKKKADKVYKSCIRYCFKRLVS